MIFNRYTASKAESNVIYCLVLDWPLTNEIILGALKDKQVSMVTLLGSDVTMTFSQEAQGLRVLFPVLNVHKLPCLWAWALKITLQK